MLRGNEQFRYADTVWGEGMKIIVAGGTGFIGKALVDALARENRRVVVLTREPAKFSGSASFGVTVVFWDGRTPGAWEKGLSGADAIINLSGENIAARRWTPIQKQKIVSSRVEATAALVRAVEKSDTRPSVLINASAAGYYGDVPSTEVPESAPQGKGFLADTCMAWEREALRAGPSGVRVALMRFGIVLEKDGGVLKKMLGPFRFFLGGPFGSGGQWFPWVHRDDVVGSILHALKNPELKGPVNVAAPDAVTVRDFCGALGKAIGRPSWLPLPAFALRLLLGEMSELLLTGQRAVPARLLESGYSFRYPRLAAALSAVFRDEAENVPGAAEGTGGDEKIED